MFHDMEPNIIVTRQKPGIAIADCNSRSLTEDINEANARLIAKAPEMHELLERLTGLGASLCQPGVDAISAVSEARALLEELDS